MNLRKHSYAYACTPISLYTSLSLSLDVHYVSPYISRYQLLICPTRARRASEVRRGARIHHLVHFAATPGIHQLEGLRQITRGPGPSSRRTPVKAKFLTGKSSRPMPISYSSQQRALFRLPFAVLPLSHQRSSYVFAVIMVGTKGCPKKMVPFGM